MELLLDTHTFIWGITEPKLLPKRTLDLIGDVENKCFISIASLWEIAIKYSLGRIELKSTIENIFSLITGSGFELLNISPEHILGLPNLPLSHHDPFDRIIIAQAIHENLVVVTKDKAFKDYPVQIFWK